MAYYLVKARPLNDLAALKAELESGDVERLRPFGRALDYSLRHARQAGEGWITWEEEDYCTPPLAMERRAVLDRYFGDLSTARVEPGQGWRQIDALPDLWTLKG
jgi:hypothetical protein